MRYLSNILYFTVVLWPIVFSHGLALADDKADSAADKSKEVTVANGKIHFHVPTAWQAKQPRVRMIEREFSISPAEGDEAAGRLTVMCAMGTVEQNVQRWIGQFGQSDGTPTNKRDFEVWVLSD